jgi:hypothetical protein
VREIVENAEKQAADILSKNLDLLNKLAEALLEKEVLDGTEIAKKSAAPKVFLSICWSAITPPKHLRLKNLNESANAENLKKKRYPLLINGLITTKKIT